MGLQLPGETVRFIMQGPLNEKARYFERDAAGYLLPHKLPKEQAEAWRHEYNLCNCNSCQDEGCKVRQSSARFPVDAGGQDQCLRLMKEKTPYVWRNADGRVIVIPDEVVKAIREV